MQRRFNTVLTNWLYTPVLIEKLDTHPLVLDEQLKLNGEPLANKPWHPSVTTELGTPCPLSICCMPDNHPWRSHGIGLAAVGGGLPESSRQS